MLQPSINQTRLLVPAILLTMLLAACTPAVNTLTPPVEPTDLTSTATTTAPVEVTQPEATAAATEPEDAGVAYGFVHNGLVENLVTETIPAVPASDDHPYWEVMPEYMRATLEGYPIDNSILQPQIFIYPVSELASYNESAAQQADDLTTLLGTQQVGESLPFLPLQNAAQMMHAQVQFLDFKSGKGVRYLTQFAQGLVTVNNQSLIYTFQGLTNDGKYYVAAILPVNYPDLPSDELAVPATTEPFWSDYSGYVAGMAQTLEGASSATFTPDLAKLDDMMASLEIK